MQIENHRPFWSRVKISHIWTSHCAAWTKEIWRCEVNKSFKINFWQNSSSRTSLHDSVVMMLRNYGVSATSQPLIGEKSDFHIYTQLHYRLAHVRKTGSCFKQLLYIKACVCKENTYYVIILRLVFYDDFKLYEIEKDLLVCINYIYHYYV